MPFAAYDALSIYAIGGTPEQAIVKARDEVSDPSAEFETATISAAFAIWIEENGWDGKRRSFDIRNGRIVDTTEEG